MNNSKISGLFLVARKQLDFEFFLLHFVGASLLNFVKFIWEKKKKKKFSCNSFIQLFRPNRSTEKNFYPLVALPQAMEKIEDLSQCPMKKTGFSHVTCMQNLVK